jgi:hypothetical protein
VQLRNGEGGLDAPRAPASRQGCGPPRMIGRSLPGAIRDQELVFQEKRLRDQGTDATRSEQPGQRGDQVDNKNGQIAHRRIVAGWEILRNHGRNNNSPGTRDDVPDFLMARDTAAQRKRKSLDAIGGEGTNYARHPITVKSANGELFAATPYRVIHPRAGYELTSNTSATSSAGFANTASPQSTLPK